MHTQTHAHTRRHVHAEHTQKDRKDFSAFKAGRKLDVVLFPLSSCSDKHEDQEG